MTSKHFTNPPLPGNVAKYIVKRAQEGASQQEIVDEVKDKFNIVINQSIVSKVSRDAGIRRHRQHHWMTDDEEAVAKAFLVTHEARAMSQSALAEMLHVSTSTVGRLERELGIQRGESRTRRKTGKTGAVGRYVDREALEAEAYQTPLKSEARWSKRQADKIRKVEEAYEKLVSDALLEAAKRRRTSREDVRMELFGRKQCLSLHDTAQIMILLQEPGSEHLLLSDISKEYGCPVEEVVEIAKQIDWKGFAKGS